MAKTNNKAKSAVVRATEATAAHYAKKAGKPTAWDKVKDYINTGRQYQVKAIEDTATYYADRLNSKKQNNLLVREEDAPEPDTLAGMSYSGDPKLNAYLQKIKANADKAVNDPRPAEKPAILNEAKKFVNTAADKTKDFINTGRQYRVKAIEDTADYYAEKAMNKPKTDDTWFQSGAFSDGWQRGDLRNAAQATLTDLNMNAISGAFKLGENAADSTRMLGAWSYGGLVPPKERSIYPVYSFSLDAREAEKQRAADFVAKDLVDEDAIAETIYSDYLAKHPDIDVRRDSLLGDKSRVLAKEAGELAAVSVLQAVGVPWWLTTGVYAFGDEAENAAQEGATFDEAATSGLISAGAEIIVGTISKKVEGLRETPNLNKIEGMSVEASKKLIEKLKSYGLKGIEGGFEEVTANMLKKFGQWLTYQDDKTFREIFRSNNILNEVIEDFASGFLLSFIDPTKQKRNTTGKNPSKGDGGSWTVAKGGAQGRHYALSAPTKYPLLPEAYKPPLLPATSNSGTGSIDLSRNIYSERLDERLRSKG